MGKTADLSYSKEDAEANAISEAQGQEWWSLYLIILCVSLISNLDKVVAQSFF